MRLFLLLVILGLVCAMTYEFKVFSDHYDYIGEQLDYIWSHCDNLKGARIQHK